jgi:hypothetical protein
MRTRTLAGMGGLLLAGALILGSIGMALAMRPGSAMPWGSSGMMESTPMGGKAWAA